MQTDAVDCENLSTPLLRIEDKGIKRSAIYVYVSKGG
jgi:hypothetical protein